ncbi:glycosyltransferase family 4 protein [Candidatus Falkowbacteria bacterium CG_4_9_14_3_um_filter_38_19]|uniref:Glycosyltransferase family 4 protein n=2 Tax=Candidatus Falkowiibacteriota TaxID=1752728 RepID=A0A2M6WRL7_9BACT|nr:glycosyltransferase family 4 protein [Candidatus Falkowbacteria bacterium]PIT95457.1 MAG: glycosyltransferase family 4 protein [Candidatus Falkowbacteria bacterium CG10_big_fil_rev_8_21_14_0_10_38_22]PJB17205.1 MAG: glycosyltransferase family 4 protein [Candidatus Falkowbacteria bacterium CG_4_9_14_3_um_filter_38_19]
MRVALVHDHLAQDGGAEKVLKVLADLFPQAPIYTLLCEKKNIDKYYKNRQIETSIIQRLPGGVKHYQWYMPFMPMAVEFFDLSGYNVVISDTSSFAKGVITTSHTLHICYCHTPTRYIWSDTHQYINELKYNKYFKKLISLVLNYIRMWDRLAADRVDKFIANSNFVARRIKKYYQRDPQVIYPPVEIARFKVSSNISDYFLTGGRLVPYKRVDLAIVACQKLGKKLKIFGDGVDLKRLKKIVGKDKNIEFVGRIDEETKADLYSHCLAFINPQEEDFGITVVEAMASGRPVIAYGSGGAREIVKAGITGEFFSEQKVDSLAEVLRNFDATKFDPRAIRHYVEKFSVERFKKEISDFINQEYDNFKSPNT